MAAKKGTLESAEQEAYLMAVTAVNALQKKWNAADAEWKRLTAEAQKMDNERYNLNTQLAAARQREVEARRVFTVCSLDGN
jgi:hypothetical protein